ncbi:MAG: LapA family protein [Gammaproteobacteria bacterium]|nr:LapA family protein [Gammaproteobacteria bacterium]
MAKLFYSLIVILMALIGITFPYMNNQQVELRYFGFSGEINLSVLLLSVLIMGVIAGFFVNLWALVKCRSKLSQSRRKTGDLVSSR